MEDNDQRQFVMVLTTVATEEDARLIAKSVVSKRLAACVQRTTIQSTYWWENEVNEDPEYLLTFKTRKGRVAELFTDILAQHPYDTPELIEVPITGGSDTYLEWIMESTS